MTKQEEDKIIDIVVDVIQNVIFPILEEHSNKLNDLAEVNKNS